MAKKDFSEINTGRGNAVTQQIKVATSKRGQQAEVTPEEAALRASQLRTQGRKGCKATRINMAFTPENHEFIKIMAGVTGQSMTEFANLVIQRYREEHPDLYEKAKSIKDSVNGIL